MRLLDQSVSKGNSSSRDLKKQDRQHKLNQPTFPDSAGTAAKAKPKAVILSAVDKPCGDLSSK